MRFSAQEKLLVVKQVIDCKTSISAVSKKSGISRKTIYHWVGAYKKTANRSKALKLTNSYARGKLHPRYTRGRIINKVKGVVANSPTLSATQIAKKLNVGRHLVVSSLLDLNLSKLADRQSFARLRSPSGRLAADIKAQVARNSCQENCSITGLSREFGIA